MNIVDELNSRFLTQDLVSQQDGLSAAELEKYKKIASGYAEMENAVAVLSDMHTNISYVYYGHFSQTLGWKQVPGTEDRIDSIWEEVILKQIYPDDLHEKYLQELRFFHFVRRQPKMKRADFYLASKLRMKDGAGNYQFVLHRLFYVSSPVANGLWLALCVYTPWFPMFAGKSVVVNSVTGEGMELGRRDDSQILSYRETQILRLIAKGMMSKDIAILLSISIHTVSRHRQEILRKLQVKSSIEACRVAKELGIM